MPKKGCKKKVCINCHWQRTSLRLVFKPPSVSHQLLEILVNIKTNLTHAYSSILLNWHLSMLGRFLYLHFVNYTSIRCDTKGAEQSQKMVRYLNYRMYAVEDVHYTVLNSADNGADQLNGYMCHAADLHMQELAIVSID